MGKHFTEQYNPKKLESFVLPERISKLFVNGIDKNYLFSGDQGLGKSSLAKFLASSSEYVYKYHNAARDGSVEQLRDGGDIFNFCSESQINFDGKSSKQKILLLDEINGVSIAFFEAFKGFMDTFRDKVIFIATTNFINSVPKPIISRLGGGVDFGFQSEDERQLMLNGYMKRLASIMKHQEIEFDNDSLKKFTLKFFPDFRLLLEKLEELKKSGVKKLTSDYITDTYSFKELFELIIKGDVSKPELIHSLLMGKYSNQSDLVMQSLDNDFIEYVEKNYKNKLVLIPNIAIKNSHYMSVKHTGINPALHMKALVFELILLFNKIKG